MRDEERLYFIFNPVAGRGRVTEALGDIFDCFTGAGYETVTRTTGGKGGAEQCAEQLANQNYACIVCCGGDGTLDEVVSGLMRGKRNEIAAGGVLPLLGYLPAGSTNDFARSLEIPANLKKAAGIVTEGDTARCDIGRFGEDRYFVYVAAFGIFTDVAYSTPQDEKNLLGHSAYIVEGTRKLVRGEEGHPIRMKLTGEGISEEGEFLIGLITNSRSVGGFSGLMGEAVDLSDGLFEVTFIRNPDNPWELGEILQSLISGDITNNRHIVHFKTSRLRIEAETEVPWTLDGEFGGSVRDTVVEVVPRVLQIRVPKTPEGTAPREERTNGED